MNRDGKRRRGERTRRHELPRCPTTGKVSFASRAKARKKLGRPGALEVYDCRHCPFWHTTSSRTRDRRRPKRTEANAPTPRVA